MKDVSGESRLLSVTQVIKLMILHVCQVLIEKLHEVSSHMGVATKIILYKHEQKFQQ